MNVANVQRTKSNQRSPIERKFEDIIFHFRFFVSNSGNDTDDFDLLLPPFAHFWICWNDEWTKDEDIANVAGQRCWYAVAGIAAKERTNINPFFSFFYFLCLCLSTFYNIRDLRQQLTNPICLTKNKVNDLSWAHEREST